jgi:hypothetical protein
MPSKKKSAAKKPTTPAVAPEARAERSRIGKASRDKGKRGERAVVKLLAALWPDGERRIQDRGATKDGPDIVFARARLHGEVKHRKTTAIQMAIRDARNNCRPGFFWFAVDWITNGKALPVIAFDLHEFVEFMQLERAYNERVGYDRGLADGALRSRLPLPELPPGFSVRQVDGNWYDERGHDPGIGFDRRIGYKDRAHAVARCWSVFMSSANADLSPEWRAYFDAARKAATP